MRRVEYDKGWGWIARKRDGTEVIPNFFWRTRASARTACDETDMFEDAAKKAAAKKAAATEGE